MAAPIATLSLLSGSERTIYAAFSVPGISAHDKTPLTNHVSKYEYQWRYRYVETEGWFYPSDGNKNSTETTTRDHVSYEAPDGCWKVAVKVKATATKYKKKSKKVAYFKAEWSDWFEYSFESFPFPQVDTPELEAVEGDTSKIKASLMWTNNTKLSAFMQYNLIDQELLESEDAVNAGVFVKAAMNSYGLSSVIFDLDTGHTYRVRARAIHTMDGTISSSVDISGEWSPWSAPFRSLPDTPQDITVIPDSSSETYSSVRASWDAVKGADGYLIEYATKEEYFDVNTQRVESVSTDSQTRVIVINGLEVGGTYYFRLAATQGQDVKSGWSPVKTITIGRKPEAPTTWSSTTTAKVGDNVNLYWVHNSTDGSFQTYANLELEISGRSQIINIENIYLNDPEKRGQTSVYPLNTNQYSDGAVIRWRVQTKGAYVEYGDWSVWRTLTIHTTPTLIFNQSCADNVTSFPLVFSVTAGPSNQTAVRFFASIIALSSYASYDEDGTYRIVNEGDAVYTRYIDGPSNTAIWNIEPGDVILNNGIDYRMSIYVVMDSGLSADISKDFSVHWAIPSVQVDADVADYEPGDYNMYLTPHCVDISTGELVSNCKLSVWRRDVDGKFTLIQNNIPNTAQVTVNDPHPALDYGRYRISATMADTGIIVFNDLPDIPVEEKILLIQWDEAWTDYSSNTEVDDEEGAWTGSRLKLPYNIDASSSYSQDVGLVEYIGRSHPVSYYGTQKGESVSYNAAIDKQDTDTMNMLRRLAKYPGDVYVRDPQGLGYWAQVTVSFNANHNELIVPITINATRVEGGM